MTVTWDIRIFELALIWGWAPLQPGLQFVSSQFNRLLGLHSTEAATAFLVPEPLRRVCVLGLESGMSHEQSPSDDVEGDLLGKIVGEICFSNMLPGQATLVGDWLQKNQWLGGFLFGSRPRQLQRTRLLEPQWQAIREWFGPGIFWDKMGSNAPNVLGMIRHFPIQCFFVKGLKSSSECSFLVPHSWLIRCPYSSNQAEQLRSSGLSTAARAWRGLVLDVLVVGLRSSL